MVKNDKTKILVIAHTLSPKKNAGGVRVSKFIKFLPRHNIIPFVISSNISVDLASAETEIVQSSSLSSPNFYGKDSTQRNPLKKLFITLKVAVKDALFSPDKEVWWSLKVIPTAIRTIKREKISVAFASGSPFSQFITLIALKQVCRIPIVIDFRDPWKRQITMQKQSFIRKLSVSFWESVSVRKADAIITANQLIMDDLNKYSFKGSPKVITNGFDLDDFKTPSNKEPQNATFLFLYTGKYSIYREDYNPETIFEGFKLFKKQSNAKAELLFVGPTDRGTLEYSKNYHSYGIQCLDGESRESICNRQLNADALVQFHYPHTYENAISLKVYEYLIAGKPILSFNVRKGMLFDFIKANRLGNTFSSHSVEDIALGFELAFTRKIEYNPDNAYSAIERYDYYNLTGELAELINKQLRSK